MTAFTPKSAKPDNVTDRGKVERIKLSGAGDSTEETEWIDVATQAELDAHASDSTSVHGITDTSALLTTSSGIDALSDVTITAAASGDILRHNGTAWVDAVGTTHFEAAGAVAAHEADTTSVHGIADTSALLDTSDIGVSVQGYSAVLAATTASFTTADETKLDGIEALADVTDETNVVAALSGATLTDVGTPASGDKILLLDTSDSDNLKTAAFSTFGGGGGSGPTYVFKTVDESVTSSTTLQDDDELLFAVDADSVYVARFVVFYSGGTTEDGKFAVTFPSDASALVGHAAARSNDALLQSAVYTTSGGPVAAGAPGLSALLQAVITVWVDTAATAGNVTLQFAQFTSGGNAITVKAGSWVEYTKVA